MAVDDVDAFLVAQRPEVTERTGHHVGIPDHPGQELPVHVLARVARVGREDPARPRFGPHPERLVPGRVSRRRHEHDRPIAEDVVLAVERLVAERVVEVPDAWHVASGPRGIGGPRGLELGPLDEEGRAGEELVPPAVVEVEVRVGDVRDVVGREPEPRELTHDFLVRTGAHPEAPCAGLAETPRRIGDRVPMDARVEEQPTTRMDDEDAGDRHGVPRPRDPVGEEEGVVQLQPAAAEQVHGEHHASSGIGGMGRMG